MKSLKAILLCVALLAAVIGLCAQPQEIIWENVVPFQISFMDANSQGEVVIGGFTNGSTPWPYDSSFTISKYTSTGTLVWSKMLVCDGYWTFMGIYQLCINDTGEVFTYISSDVQYPTYYMVSYSQYTELDSGLIKLSTDGSLIWNRFFFVNNSGDIRMFASGENLVMIHNYRLYDDIPSYSGYGQVFVVMLNPEGSRISYKVLYSNWACDCSSASLVNESLYISGSFDNVQGGTSPPAILYFVNTTGSGTTTTNLYEIDGNKYLAKLDLSTNNWVWQRNIDHFVSPACVDDDYFYAYDSNYQGTRCLFKYSTTSGSLLDFADTGINEIVIQRLYTGIDGTLHFVGSQYSYGIVGSDLNITEYYTSSINLSLKHSADALGNQYAPNSYTSYPVSQSFVKFGYPYPYPVRPELTPVTFNSCYPEVLYESDIPFVNIGNSSLIASGLQFINATPGLTAAVLSGSTAASGDTLWVRVSLNASYTGAFSDTLVVLSNSPYVPEYKVRITGNLVAVPPLEPEGINIAVNGNNVIISWSAVTETIFNTPIEPDYYLVFISNDPYDDFTFLGATEGLQFTQPLVASFQPKMFYRVVAYKYYGRGAGELSSFGLEQGMPEAEVWRRLRE